MIKKYLGSWKSDLPASIVVFLVAVPLCLGIALASGAPLFSGIIAGIIGGVVVGAVSGSQLGVSGPAAGLVVIVISAVTELGTFELFLTAVVLAGIIQIVLGFLKAGIIGYYFPNSVIKGMLAAIGVIIILKQLPYAFGYNTDYLGSLTFFQTDGQNTFSELFHFVKYISLGSTILAIFSLLLMVFWELPFMKKMSFTKIIQGPLIVVLLGIIFNVSFQGSELFAIRPEQLVQIPVLESLASFPELFIFPDFSAILDVKIWVIAFTIAIVASLETLLCVEATDKLDPNKRITPTNLELKAQGIGNVLSGLIGGLPVTQVIVRSSANIQSGGKTKMSAIYHGLIMLVSVLAIPVLLNLIPLASLAVILIFVGYKLTKPVYFKEMWKKGYHQFVPFVVTLLAIVFTDLLIGIGIGFAVAILFVLYANFKSSFFFDEKKYKEEDVIRMRFSEEMTFLNKASLMDSFRRIPENSSVEIDVKACTYIDEDVRDVIRDFRDQCRSKNIKLSIIQDNNGIVEPGPELIKKHLGKKIDSNVLEPVH